MAASLVRHAEASLAGHAAQFIAFLCRHFVAYLTPARNEHQFVAATKSSQQCNKVVKQLNYYIYVPLGVCVCTCNKPTLPHTGFMRQLTRYQCFCIFCSPSSFCFGLSCENSDLFKEELVDSLLSHFLFYTLVCIFSFFFFLLNYNYFHFAALPVCKCCRFINKFPSK